MPESSLTDAAEAVLLAVQQAGEADVYDLAQSVGSGPRAVQEHVRSLDRAGLVIVSERGDQIRCTPAGEEYARRLQQHP
jgi:Mn-dependent DtxR family transcriptional regulator